MATLINRDVWFIDEGLQRHGIIKNVSPLGALLVNVIDGIDDLKQIIILPHQQVSYWPQNPPNAARKSDENLSRVS